MARSRLISVAFGVLAGTLGAGCVDDSVSIRIDCVIPPSADCSYSPSGEVCQSGGLINLSVAGDYFLGLRVVNGLRARARTSPPLAEPNGVNVTGFDVTIREASGATYDFGGLPNPFFAPSTAWAAPGGGKSPAGLTAVPPDYMAVLAKKEASARTRVGSLLLELSVRGQTDGHVTVESDTISYPIDLAFASADYADGQCVEADGTICLPGQDANAAACDPSTIPE